MSVCIISPGLKRLAFTIPVSMTYLIPEIVTDVSAMLVERMTFLQPWEKEKVEPKVYNYLKQLDSEKKHMW